MRRDNGKPRPRAAPRPPNPPQAALEQQAKTLSEAVGAVALLPPLLRTAQAIADARLHRAADTNLDGVLTRGEFTRAGLGDTEDFKTTDANSDGVVTLDVLGGMAQGNGRVDALAALRAQSELIRRRRTDMIRGRGAAV